MKKKISALLCIFAILVCLFSFVACKNDESNEDQAVATSMVRMDINPSVELILDQNDKVLSFRVENEDAALAFYGEEGVVGLTVEEATNKILDITAEYDYLNKDNNDVSISVYGKDGDAENAIFTKIKASMETNTETYKFDVVINNNNSDFSNEIVVEKLKDRYPNLTVSKYALINEAVECDASLTFDAAYEMSISDLLKTININSDKVIDDVSNSFLHVVDNYLAKMQEKYESSKETRLKSATASAYISSSKLEILQEAAEYSALVGSESLLQSLSNIKDGVLNHELTDAQINAVLNALAPLNTTVDDLKDSTNEIVTTKSVINYINNQISVNASFEATVGEDNIATIKAQLVAAENNPVKLSLLISAPIKALSYLDLDKSADELTLDDVDEILAKIKAKEEVVKDQIEAKLTEEDKASIKAKVDETMAKFDEVYERYIDIIDGGRNKILQSLQAEKESLKENKVSFRVHGEVSGQVSGVNK